MEIKKNNILLVFAIIIYFSIGPIFYNLPIKLIYLVIFLFGFVFFNKRLNLFKGDKIIYFLFFLYIITTLITSTVNNTYVPVIYTTVFIIAFFTAIHYEQKDILKLTEILTDIFKYILILAWIGFIYSIFGKPLFSLPYGGKILNFYLTTFGESLFQSTRPTGIYDEPGALSFFVCLLVSYRTHLKLNSFTSLYLLLLGLVTQSLAHGVFLAIWGISEIVKFRNNEKYQTLKKLIFVVVLFLFSYAIYQSGILGWQIERTMGWIENPETAGRMISYNNLLNEVEGNTHNFLFGFDKGSIDRTTTTNDYGENILTPLIFGGLLVAWPFYLFIVFCFIYPLITFKRFYLMGLGLLLFQRPYFLELPYSFCIALLIGLFINEGNGKIPLKKLHYIKQ